jgi:hypothetical protein
VRISAFSAVSFVRKEVRAISISVARSAVTGILSVSSTCNASFFANSKPSATIRG